MKQRKTYDAKKSDLEEGSLLTTSPTTETNATTSHHQARAERSPLNNGIPGVASRTCPPDPTPPDHHRHRHNNNNHHYNHRRRIYPTRGGFETTTTTPAPPPRTAIRMGRPASARGRGNGSPRGGGARPDPLVRRILWALVLVCPFSFGLSIVLSVYLLEELQFPTAASDGSTSSRTSIVDPTTMTHLSQPLRQWLPNRVHDWMPSLWWVDQIDMRELSYTLPFDNQPASSGGWTQGWELEPVPVGTTTTATTLHHETLQVFVVPHSHCDPGWLKTFDQYFQTQTKQIIDTVVSTLTADARRKFIWAEISYLEWWWRQADDAQRQALRRLLDRGQLELVTGSWVMPDEANSQIYALEIQMQEGHDWIRDTLGEQYIPSYAWSIDPFGYSPTMAYLLAKHNFTAMVIQRVHYAVKKELAKRQHLEFKWRQTWDDQGQYDIWTHVLPFFSYDVPHSCGPDPAVCCQFDFARRPVGKAAPTCPWKKAPQLITDDNVEERAKLLVDQYRKKAALYRSRAVLVPLGDDFRFQTVFEAESQFNNYQKLFQYINTNMPGVQVQFGTLKDYFQAATKSNMKLPLLKGSFFTYADVNEDYWSGYYTSRAFDKALDRRLERLLYTAERLGAQKSELREARRALSLFQHHDGVTGTATERVVHDYAYRMKSSIETTQEVALKYLRLEHGAILQANFGTSEVLPCFASGSPRGMEVNLCKDDGIVVVYNPLGVEQKCVSVPVPPYETKVVKLPCDRPGPAIGSLSNLVFDATTGLLLEPFREEWMGWHVKKGGAYLFHPDHLFRFDREKPLVHDMETYTVFGPGWNRTVVEQPVPPALVDKVSVIDFIFETHLQTDNDEWFVRFSADITNKGYFHTDLNGFNFDTHRFRRDLPIQSQVFPMPTHASIQDEKYRLTILSEHSQGTASLQDGSINVWLDRRLAQDDGRGLGQGVQDNVPTRTRLRVILEKGTFEYDNQNFQVTDLVRSYWNQLQHPLEIFGPHRKKLDESQVVADPAKVEKERHERRNFRERLRNGLNPGVPPKIERLTPNLKIPDAFNDDKMRGRVPVRKFEEDNADDIQSTDSLDEHGDVPFVFMVYNRLHYLNQSIESLRQSDFPRESVPIIISHDGHVPEVVQFVEEIKADFQVIQLFHPFSCHEHPNSFPMDDTKLNNGYQGDKAKNPRTGKITCAKHHFTWMLNEVFSLNITTPRGASNNFAFLEEDYLLGPSIYEAILEGLRLLDEADEQVKGGVMGLELDPTFAGNRKEQTQLGDKWYTMQWATGPMTLSRKIYQKIKDHFEVYCTFDDYNWDWSLVRLSNEEILPHTILGPAHMLVKHIGAEGMHTEQLKKIKRKQKDVELVPWVGHKFIVKRVAKKKAPGYGGWGHPADQEHCRNLFLGKGNLTRLYEFWDLQKNAYKAQNKNSTNK